jgi:hypothetical protein
MQHSYLYLTMILADYMHARFLQLLGSYSPDLANTSHNITPYPNLRKECDDMVPILVKAFSNRGM